jgi:hypothetical protein
MSDDSEEQWYVEIFETPEQAASFMNHLRVRPEQLVQVQLQSLAANVQRILFVGRLTVEQVRSRSEWLSVERILNPEAVQAATGGGH